MTSSIRKRVLSVVACATVLVTASLTGSVAAAQRIPGETFRGVPVTSSLPGAPGGLSQVEHLDLESYQGTWNQIAVVPQVFNAQCARDTRATYTLVGDGLVEVVNTCTDWFGNRSGIRGSARVTDPATDASLRVAFEGVPFQDPDGPTNYRVTWMSDDGETVIVGNPNRSAGFILSRRDDLTLARWREISAVVGDRGYNPCMFITSPVTGGVEGYRPLCTL